MGWILKIIGRASEVSLENGNSCYVKTSSLIRQIAEKVLLEKNEKITEDEINHILNLDNILPFTSIHKMKVNSVYSSTPSSITINTDIKKTIHSNERSTIDEDKLALIFKRFFDFPVIKKI